MRTSIGKNTVAGQKPSAPMKPAASKALLRRARGRININTSRLHQPVLNDMLKKLIKDISEERHQDGQEGDERLRNVAMKVCELEQGAAAAQQQATGPPL